MLDLFRKQKAASKWILGVITGIMALGMIVFFIPAPTTMSDGSSDATIAKVGKTEISTSDFVVMFRRFLKNTNGPKDVQFLKQFGIPRQLLDEMVTRKLLLQEAQKFGLGATDKELRERILAYPLFQQVGGFNMQLYTRALQQSGMSVEEFEENERNQILVDKLRHLVTDGIVVTPEEAQKAYRENNEKVTLDYVLFDPMEIQKTVKGNEAELKKYFDANKQKFMTTEQRKAKYMVVDTNKIRTNLRLTDDDLRQYYDQNRIRYFVGDRTRVSHILFSTAGKSPEESQKIREKALEVLARVRKGEDFAQLARQYSDDPGSKIVGGDLGWADPSTPFVPEFKRVALSLGVGAVSDLVQTQFGFHIIKAIDHQTAHTMSFDEAKELIKPTLAAQKVDRAALDLANKIFAAVAPKPQELEVVARQFGADVKETPLFAAGDSVPEIGSNPDFEKKVFATSLNKVGDPVRVSLGFVIPEVVDIKAPHVPELAEARAKVEPAFKQEKAVELAKQKAETFAKNAAAAKDFAAAANSAGFKAETTEPFKRNASVKTLGSTADISAAAFSLKVGDTSGVLKLPMKYIVFRLKSKEEMNPEDFEKNKASWTAQLLEQKRAAAFQSFQEELLTRNTREGRVKVNEKALDSAITRRI